MLMPKIQAWERLNDPEYSARLDMQQFHSLLLAAGYDEETAQRAANERGWQRLKAGVKM